MPKICVELPFAVGDRVFIFNDQIIGLVSEIKIAVPFGYSSNFAARFVVRWFTEDNVLRSYEFAEHELRAVSES